MRKHFKTYTFYLLTAFVGVFVFGCVQAAVLDDGMMTMQVAGDHQKASDTRDNDHMNIAMALPVSVDQVVPFALALLLLASVLMISRKDELFIDPSHTRWRLRSRKETFVQWNLFVHLFQTGLLSPKVL